MLYVSYFYFFSFDTGTTIVWISEICVFNLITVTLILSTLYDQLLGKSEQLVEMHALQIGLSIFYII
jgi:hypothetical protein